MAQHNSTFTGPDTQDAFLADRQRAFDGFVRFTTISCVFLAVLLSLMAIFLI